MKELKESVKVLMHEEYERAAEKFGKRFHSTHESYAVLKEEIEEAESEMKVVIAYLDEYWIRAKCNIDTDDLSKMVEERALNAACELIRVAAMAYKARR